MIILTIFVVLMCFALYVIIGFRRRLVQQEGTIKKLRQEAESLRQQLNNAKMQVEIEAHRAQIVQNVYTPLAKVTQRIADDLMSAYAKITELTQNRDKALELVVSRTAALNHEKSISSRYRNSRDKLQDKLDKLKEVTT